MDGRYNPRKLGLNASTHCRPCACSMCRENATGIDVDQAGDAYVVAQGGWGFPVTAGAFQRCINGGGNDVIAAELDPDGLWFSETPIFLRSLGLPKS